jgi:hypothetical protein
MPFSKGVTGTAFQVLLKMPGEFYGFKRRVELDFPRPAFGRVKAFARIMFHQSLFEISSVPTIKLFWLAGTLKNISVKHGVFLMACHP